MGSTSRDWTVIDAENGIYSLVYAFSGQQLSTTFVARFDGDKLLVVSPACNVPEAVFQKLDTFGKVDAVVASNGFHYLGQSEWKRRYPSAHFYAAPESAKRIAKKDPNAPTFEPLSKLIARLPGDVRVFEVSPSRLGETWACAKSANGYVWYVSDTLANMASVPPTFPVKQMFEWTKSAPGYRVFNLALLVLVKSRKKVIAKLLQQMRAFPPSMVIPAHGAPIDGPGAASRTFELLEGR
ncbi:MAG: hypothetical protein R3A47_10350 [Polyangiales bacterium]